MYAYLLYWPIQHEILGYLYHGRIDALMLFPSDNLQSSLVGASKSSTFGENIIRVSNQINYSIVCLPIILP